MMKALWEILVPSATNDGVDILISYHREWDEKVRKICGGLTILKSAKGQWVSPDGRLFKEKMIPVRVACTKEQIEQIMDITLKHYDQEEVLAYKISDTVIFKKSLK